MADGYYNFLVSLINGDDCDLYRYLYYTNYSFTIQMDKNRAQDGIDLRCLYTSLFKLDENAYYEIFANKPCSMLEMLIAFANRIENDFLGCAGENETTRWFHIMLSTLGLESFIHVFDRGMVDHILLNFFNHQIPLFPINGVDISDMQLWDQLNCWLNQMENLEGGFLV